LFADDQIPSENLRDKEIKAALKDEHPEWSDKFINAFPIMRRAVQTLRDANYDVTVVRTYKDALELVKTTHFDIAVVDLGWFADKGLSETKRRYAGWDISAAIEEADKQLKAKPTLQIIYSRRFAEDATISMRAAEGKKLPVYKVYGDPGHQALRAAVKFIESHLNPTDDRVNDLWQMIRVYWEEPLKQQRQWFKLTIAFVALSLVLLLGGVVGAVSGNVQVGTLTSISSIITGAISTLLYSQLKSMQLDVDKTREVMQQEFRKAFEQLHTPERE